MTAPLPLPPLTPKDVFFAALAAGRTVPEDKSHLVFANCIVKQLYKLGYPVSAAGGIEQPEVPRESAATDDCATSLPLPDCAHADPQPLRALQRVHSDVDALGEVWRACLEAVAQRIVEMDPAGFNPTSCASALRALVRTSSLQCLPCPDQLKDAQ
ncbi:MULTISPECIES: hypothetical protein [Achromobacter]|uniref:Uncharacterized protein n=1 Tax=Achromobacter aegrifaciens TaxID=1287736 RepID=A0AAD2J4W0_ACHAE|nr:MULTISPECIES: hypothetical protein [Achromobacter]CAB3892121.1 hypothetical protein LMG26684_04152 [Achromobacter mucicolens]CUJ71905.1 Uncharacterised protein [Achromobacter aegrifaciens]